VLLGADPILYYTLLVLVHNSLVVEDWLVFTYSTVHNGRGCSIPCFGVVFFLGAIFGCKAKKALSHCVIGGQICVRNLVIGGKMEGNGALFLFFEVFAPYTRYTGCVPTPKTKNDSRLYTFR
jgi:hypothetical protein